MHRLPVPKHQPTSLGPGAAVAVGVLVLLLGGTAQAPSTRDGGIPVAGGSPAPDATVDTRGPPKTRPITSCLEGQKPQPCDYAKAEEPIAGCCWRALRECREADWESRGTCYSPVTARQSGQRPPVSGEE